MNTCSFGRIAVIAALANGATAAPAFGDFTLPPGQLFGRDGYDYAPSMYYESGVQRFWWCGRGTVPGTSFETDVIYHRAYSFAAAQWSGISMVLWPSNGRWDGYYTCDPSVIRGSFYNPDNGLTYLLAMYYSGTDRSDGNNNRVGVAFSNDGINWTKFGAPVIHPQGSAILRYGAGQPATYSRNGRAAIYLFHVDDSTAYGTRMWVRTASDGLSFGAPTMLSDAGAPLRSNSDFAYDWRTGYVYAAIGLPPRTGDRETLGFVLARMLANDLLNGRGTWEQLGTISTNLTGFGLNHSPGLLRDGQGYLTTWLPAVEAYFAGGANDPSTWDLTWVIWTPEPSTLPFDRYFNSSSRYHKVTTGYVESGFLFEATLGYLFMAPRGGTVALHGCRAGVSDFFISRDPNCEGHFVLGLNGWIHAAAQVGTRALYRCYTGFDHFVSTDPRCEGWTTETLLGFARTTP